MPSLALPVLPRHKNRPTLRSQPLSSTYVVHSARLQRHRHQHNQLTRKPHPKISACTAAATSPAPISTCRAVTPHRTTPSPQLGHRVHQLPRFPHSSWGGAAGVLRPLTEVCEAECQVRLHLLVREKGSDGTQQAAQILQGLKDTGPEPVLGVLSKGAW